MLDSGGGFTSCPCWEGKLHAEFALKFPCLLQLIFLALFEYFHTARAEDNLHIAPEVAGVFSADAAILGKLFVAVFVENRVAVTDDEPVLHCLAELFTYRGVGVLRVRLDVFGSDQLVVLVGEIVVMLEHGHLLRGRNLGEAVDEVVYARVHVYPLCFKTRLDEQGEADELLLGDVLIG